ncbi:MAG: molecular chaperone HscC [Cellvibrionaceae bacterium]|jgi:molecular chaperone HscC
MAIIGIDLGTTNSLAAYWDNGEPKLIPNSLGENITPSVVGFDENGDVLVGKAAKERLRTVPQKTTALFKRHMGTDKLVTLGNRKFRAEELSALVLKALKEDAEHFLGEPVTEAVISVPAYFNDIQRKATRAAGKIAGLKVERLINEPTAAAIAYGLHRTDADETFLIFDIGGGTLDISILELFEGVMQIHASAGDNFLGGEDFTEALAAAFLEASNVDDYVLTPGEKNALHAAADRCKQQLSLKTSADMIFMLREAELRTCITREQLEKISSPLLQRIRTPIERALKDSDFSPDDLTAIVLVGGASRMPIIKSLCSKMFGQLPHAHINPDEAIALGTAVQVGLKQQDSSLSEIVLTDVSPYSLGTGIVNEYGVDSDDLLFHPIIERNSPIPISKVDQLFTASDNQTALRVKVFQGESRLVRNNIKLGEVTVEVPNDKKGKQAVNVRFTYDINGLLEIHLQVVSTGAEERLVIEGNPGLLTPEEIEQRLLGLASLKVHPREQMKNTLLLARGERIFTESLGEKRLYAQQVISQFEGVLNSQDTKAIEKAHEVASKIFDSLEPEKLF